ncbi:MAG: PQQ-binding-like beta-propeller repeat protein [Verrucomicrobiales bacterium]|nr:PQQ-binding-like beta-propeller repeat protein [Verrucomicrobiales bacterium]
MKKQSSVSSPVIRQDGNICIGSWDGCIYALDGKTGAKIWEFKSNGDVEALALPLCVIRTNAA